MKKNEVYKIILLNYVIKPLLNNFDTIVGCWGVVQLGVPAPWFVRGGPTKVWVCKSILFTESSSVVEI